jgi:hypothetical protein
MNLAKLTLGFATLALALASAATRYSVSLADPTWVGDTQLKAGDYKVEVEGDHAVFQNGKQTYQVPATVEKNDHKYPFTELDASDSKLKEIHVGGTNVKIVIKGSAAAQPAGSGQ